MSDEWAEAWSQLTRALESAKNVDMTLEEVEECVENVFSEDTYYTPGPKKPKPKTVK